MQQTSKLAPEDFYKFQKLFYSDSLFQMSRIKFPIVGDVTDSSTNDLVESKIHEWNRGNWIMLRNPFFKEKDSIVQINGDTYKRKIIKEKTRIVESIFIEDSGFLITLKFSLQNGKWYLIDYTECNN